MTGAAATTVVVVAYNSAAVLGGCLESIPPGVPVVVVDNASADGSAALARQVRPGATVLEAGRNLGFGPGANLGLGAAGTPFGLLLNADARLGPDTLPVLEAAAARYPEAALLAPEIRTESGEMQVGHATPYTPPRARRLPEPWGDCCLDYVGGSAMFFRLAAWRGIGGFDPAIFLYHEDDDICLRLRAAGHALVHVAGGEVRHAGGRSSAPSPRLEWDKAWHQGWSRQHLEARHRGARAAWARLLAQWPALRLKAALRQGDGRRVKWAGRAAGMLAWARGVQATQVGLDRR
ncbi:glycosyltransferase [Roseococcus sp. DSY-14]|uniref:glycosyltransferase n=1 Tax=Roseococcus sp. DSY-14 TaxID=3369650 RepID=UPI00387AF468